MDKKLKENMEFISNELEVEELFCKLAENAAALAQSALKYKREIETINSSSETLENTKENLLIELANVSFMTEMMFLLQIINKTFRR